MRAWAPARLCWSSSGLSWAVTIATAFVLRAAQGYRPFPSIDDFAYIPLARAAADPELYPGDLFVQESILHVPLWPWLISVLESMGDLAQGLWLLTLLLSLLTVAAFARLIRAFEVPGLLVPVAAMIAFGGLLHGLGRGQYDGAFGNAFHMQWLALCAALWCYDAFVRGHALLTGVLLAVTTIAHPIVGAHAGFAVLIALPFAGAGRIRLAATIGAAWLIVSAPVTLPLAAGVLGGAGEVSAAQRVAVVDDGFLFRTPHEFTLSATGPLMIDLFGVIAVAGVVGCALLARDGPQWRAARLSGLIAGHALLAGTFLLAHGAGLEMARLPGAVLLHQLHLSRTTPLLLVLAMVAFGAALERRLISPQGPAVTSAWLLGAALASLALATLLLVQVRWQPLLVACLVLALASLLAWRSGVLRKPVLGAWLALALAGFVSTVAEARLRAEPEPGAVALYAWARTETPREALFIVPPGAEAFRLFARRGVYVDFKTFPAATPALIPTWRARLEQVATPDRLALEARGWPGVDHWDRTYANRNTPSRIAALLRTTGADYFVWDRHGLQVPPFLPIDRTPDARLKQVFANERFIVYRLRETGRAR